MNEEQRNGESGEKPELSRNCKGGVRLPQSFHKGAGERGTEPGCRLYFIIKRLREAWSRMRGGKTFSHSDLAVPFFINVTFMAGGMPGRKEEGAQWGFLIRR